jgi:hypothetical protein
MERERWPACAWYTLFIATRQCFSLFRSDIVVELNKRTASNNVVQPAKECVPSDDGFPGRSINSIKYIITYRE